MKKRRNVSKADFKYHLLNTQSAEDKIDQRQGGIYVSTNSTAQTYTGHSQHKVRYK